MNGNFEVESVIERQTLTATGELKPVTVVYIMTGRGARGSVEVPTRDFDLLTSTPEGQQTLQGMLAKKANSLDAPFEM